MWSQTVVTIGRKARGCHLITNEIERAAKEISNVRVGLAHLFLQHTSASISINENVCREVRTDMEMTLNHVIPETLPYDHTDEGPDDMPAHAKSTLVGVSLTIPISDGKLALGTWQGIYLLEHRDHASARRIVVTIQGDPKDSAAARGGGSKK